MTAPVIAPRTKEEQKWESLMDDMLIFDRRPMGPPTREQATGSLGLSSFTRPVSIDDRVGALRARSLANPRSGRLPMTKETR
ncbi:MAG: hypothetical protein JO094_01995 [Hyphomicrobiales bacterium]|nr:hypothetical protein [Hyphomicrobiales bacterium]MBV9752923.1 hypothetical protein [Hyphomicrobiales bacterium]